MSTPNESRREALATLLDSVHGPWVTEGGCDFQAWRRGWRPGENATVNGDVVDPILEGLRSVEPSAAQVDAAARALNPEAWRAYDNPLVENPELLVEPSRTQARAALRAAGGA